MQCEVQPKIFVLLKKRIKKGKRKKGKEEKEEALVPRTAGEHIAGAELPWQAWTAKVTLSPSLVLSFLFQLSRLQSNRAEKCNWQM